MAAGGLVRLLFPGLGAVCQRQAHPFAGNGAHGQGVSPEEVSCSAIGDRHGAWPRSLLAVRPDCGGAGIENEQGFLFVG